jgi:Uma2 family endonuclease
MATKLPRPLLEIKYEKAAEEYLRSLRPEHFMESTAQATQRKITLESLDFLNARRPEVQVFNELLIQYPIPGQSKPQQVVPDNMVVVWKEPIKARGSFNLPLQPVKPFWVLEYASKETERKDYEESFRKYESELRVPYYLIFVPDAEELTLYRHTRRRYVSVKANENGRHAISELDLEVALLDGWVRYWHRGELIPLPADFERKLAEANRRAETAERENARLRAELDRLRGQRGDRG